MPERNYRQAVLGLLSVWSLALLAKRTAPWFRSL